MPEKQFLFINKGQKSSVLTRGDEGDEKFQLLSHVRRKRPDRPDLLKKPWMRYANSISLSQLSISVVELDRRMRNGAKQPVSEFTASLSNVYPSGNGSDPFHATIMGTSFSPHTLLKTMFDYSAQSVFVTEAYGPSALSRASRHANIMQNRVKECIGNYMLLHSSLAYASALAAWSMGEEKGHQHEEFVHKATCAIQRTLTTTRDYSDTWLQLSIYSLAITAFWDASPVMWNRGSKRHELAVKNQSEWLHGCKVHLRALVQIIAVQGGTRCAEPYVLDSLILADKYVAMLTSSAPLLPMTWDPGPRSIEDLERDAGDFSRLNEIPKGSNEVSIKKYAHRLLQIPMHSALRNLILDIVDFLVVAHWAWSKSGFDFHVESWLFRRLQALEVRLMCFKSDNLLDECLKLATLIFLLASTQNGGANTGAIVVVQRLRTTLIQADYLNVEWNTRFLLWCCCTAAMSSMPSDAKSWFTTQILSLVPSLPTVDYMNNQLDGFLFIPNRQQDSLQRLINELYKASIE